jgi:hypothetical protein
VIECFGNGHAKFDSQSNKLSSNKVLELVGDDLRAIGFQIEKGNKKDEKIAIPVLYGENGKIEKSFHADGYNAEMRYMIEVEAGRGLTNYQFLKDMFQACACDNVDALAIAVRNNYRGSDDFSKVCGFLDTVFTSRRFTLPLKEVMIIGY